MNARIVVTGIGLVTAVGSGCREPWEALLAGRSGISDIRSFDPSAYTSQRGGEIHDFEAPVETTADGLPIGRAAQFAIAAARSAVADADLDLSKARAERLGVAMGTTSGEPLFIELHNDRTLAAAETEVAGAGRNGPEESEENSLAHRAELADAYPCHTIATHVASDLGATAAAAMFPTACAAGSYALAHAFDTLRLGRADIMLAGGADAFSRITYAGFSRLGAIAGDVCRPFDRGRRGMIPAEGAGVLVLERLDDALRRGARIYAEVAGYGLGCDAHHMTAAHPQARGPVDAMRQALRLAGREADEVDYVSAHGTGTPTNDRLETLALHRVFGDRVFGAVPASDRGRSRGDERRRLAVSSVKSMLGHTMGAASAIESAVCALAVAEGRVPPTVHYEDPDPECGLDCVPNEAREMPVRLAMNNALAFGGNNASVLFAAVDTPEADGRREEA